MRAAGAAVLDDPLAGLADIQDVISHIRAQYVDVPDMEKVLAGGVRGALERANPLNSILTPEEVQLPDPGRGETGLTLLKTQLLARVIGVVRDSPADAAGFTVGDSVRRLNGEPLGPMSHWEMERKLLGAPGSEITLVRMPSGTTELITVVLVREILKRPAIVPRLETKAAMIPLPDLSPGRAGELRGLLDGADKKNPLILDLRACNGGSFDEAARVASLLGCRGLFATLKETGQPDIALDVPMSDPVLFPKIAVLNGLGTVGPAEALALVLRRLGNRQPGDARGLPKTVITLGERSPGLAVERMRFPLKQGGAVEIVSRRWVGPAGENLDRTGPAPDYSLRGIPETEDILPRVLEALEKGPPKSENVANTVARISHPPHAMPASSPSPAAARF